MAIEFAGADTSDTGGLRVTSGTAGNIGSYVPLIASTARESYQITASLRAVDGPFEGVLHVATGAASFEVAFLEIPFHGGADEVYHNTFPYTVGSGERLSMALTSTDATVDIDVFVALSDDDSWGTCTEATLIGSSGGKGTVVDPGGTANTKPTSFTELSASTSHDFDLLFAVPQHPLALDLVD